MRSWAALTEFSMASLAFSFSSDSLLGLRIIVNYSSYDNYCFSFILAYNLKGPLLVLS